MVNILTTNMEKVCIASQIKTFIWEIGKKINFMVKEFTSTLMVKNIKENSNKDLNKEEELMLTKIQQYMKENGPKIEKMDLEFLLILMDKNIKGIG